jgi:hypothetical protein
MKVSEVALYHSRFEREAKKIKGHVMHFKWWMLLLVTLAINNIALAVFNLQFTLLKSQLYRFQRPQGLFEVVTVNNKSSQPEELPLELLIAPDVNLSAHPAPIAQSQA